MDALWISTAILSIVVGVSISRRELSSHMKWIVVIIPTLLLASSLLIVLDSFLIFRSGSLALIINNLAIMAIVTLMAFVLGKYPREVDFLSCRKGTAAVFSPLAILSFVVLALPAGNKLVPRIMAVGFIASGIVLGYIIWLQIRNSTPVLKVPVLIMGYCSLILVGSKIVHNFLLETRLLPLVAEMVDGFSALATMAFVIGFSITTEKYRLFSLKPRKEERARDNSVNRERLLEKGEAYLFRSEKEAFRALSHMVSIDIPGLCVTRRSPDSVKRNFALTQTPIIWLTREKLNEEALGSANVGMVGGVISSFLDKTEGAAILLDGLEYLVINNGFEPTMKCLYDLSDKASSKGATLLLVLSLECFDKRQRSLLERNIELKQKG